MDAALPAGTQPSQLRSLSIIFSVLPLQAVHSCPFLGHLTGLTLNVCRFSDAEDLAGLEALLQQAPRLLSLNLHGYSGAPPLPPALVNRTGLRKLDLMLNDLSTLPFGPYLHSESVIVLQACWVGCPQTQWSWLYVIRAAYCCHDLRVSQVDCPSVAHLSLCTHPLHLQASFH